MPLFIQTPRFVIRDFKAEEEQTYLTLFASDQVTLHLPKRSLKENMEIFRNALTDYAVGKTLGRWGLFNNGDGDFIGLCLLREYDNNPHKVELGYVLHEKYWGKGIASEMARIMIAHGLSNTNATEIIAVTTLENAGSQKVLLKAGMMRMDNFRRDGKELAYFRIERQ